MTHFDTQVLLAFYRIGLYVTIIFFALKYNDVWASSTALILTAAGVLSAAGHRDEAMLLGLIWTPLMAYTFIRAMITNHNAPKRKDDPILDETN